MMKAFLCLILLTGCSALNAQDRVPVEQHDSDLLMCQERGRAAAAACKSADAGGNCDKAAMDAYASCKVEHKL